MTLFSWTSFQNWLSQGASRLLSSCVAVGTSAVTIALSPAAFAADDLVFTYGPLGRSIAIDDLQTLAETGEATRQIRWYLNLANLEPEVFRQVITKEIDVSVRFIDRVTYSLPGEFLLFQIGQTVHTKSGEANIQALRSALILSAAEDSKISLIEFLENYPTQQIYIDGVQLQKFAKDVGRVIDRIEPIVASAKTLLEGLVCDCENPPSTSETPTETSP